MANGEWLSAPKGDFDTDKKLEVVYENGRPSYYEEKNVRRSIEVQPTAAAQLATEHLRVNGESRSVFVDLAETADDDFLRRQDLEWTSNYRPYFKV